MKLTTIKLLLCFLILGITTVQAQLKCSTSEANKEYFKKHIQAFNEYKQTKKGKNLTFKTPPNGQYIIPVVFHVYGTDFSSTAVNQSIIEEALLNVSKDFQGQNDDFNTIDGNFNHIKSTLQIQFILAKKDPDGNATSGIVYHGEKNGYAKNNEYDTQIRQDAWDNYKYMNVYIQNDLYNDGVMNNSGVAWYPNSYMSDRNLARVVYNGRYLGTNTDKEFASVLTHEFGHWLNLIHTFEGKCSGTDEVADTPQEDGNHSLNCTPGTNCSGTLVNNENYMGYNGARGCYKMFTKGQIDRVTNALNHPARAVLWSENNLKITGLLEDNSTVILPKITWNLVNHTYFVDDQEIPHKRQSLRLQILDNEKSHTIEIYGPNDYFKEITTTLGKLLIIESLEKGTYTIRIPSEKKELKKTF